MSLPQTASNGNGLGDQAPIPALMEYEQAVRTQVAVDAVLRHAGYTGICRDDVSGDWAIWQDGRVIGWDASPGSAVRRLTECATAQALHPQTATACSARDELPCSIELQLSAKGEHYWTIKGYHAPGDENGALARLQDLDADLARHYRPELAPAS
jgi:hypothetical protein